MNRQEFIKRLEMLLADIPENDRRDAISYYENYFDDAGIGREAEIIRELESPEKVAESIKKDIFGENYNTIHSQQEELNQERRKNSILRKVLIAVLIIFTFPVWIGLIGGAIGLVLGLVGAIAGIAIAGIAVTLSLFASGGALIVIGTVKVFTGFAEAGLLCFAIGFFCLALAMVALIAAVWVCGKFVPQIIRIIVSLGQRLLKKCQRR